ncbi:MAG: hypothetical protein CVU72_01420 [Deltaproteobacteria bacterium HGW-Deltaproteobacteria-7]|jgi:hypothetical protein|nr:MAG: hypothetical protein CVU72_01420 [Deltaproteobacteria bacterium HGW-Deltaproteobacteria-7]PKN50904.1 MAG: hypothetical protein CVU55_14675 [Deltaproteobacteria bacterium HGW-Deltaproteobacteria-13]
MLNILKSFQQPPTIKNLGVKHFHIYCSLNRLALGVDNIHLDVHISRQVHNALKKTAFLLMVKYSGTEFFFKDYKREFCEIEKETLRRVCNDVLLDGINKARAASEVQIDFLAQTALVKLFLEEIKVQYKNMVAQIEPLVRMYQLSEKHDQTDIFFIKDKLAETKLHYNQIIRLVGKELFELLADVNTRKLRDMRETHFPPRDILPGFFLTNPLFHTNNPNDDFFLIEEYVLMGQRSEDIDNYKSIKSAIYELLGQVDLKGEYYKDNNADTSDRKVKEANDIDDTENYVFDSLIMRPDNIDRMFDYFDSQDLYDKAKKTKESKETLKKLKERIKTQKGLLNLFYSKFNKSRLLQRVVADFEMKPVYEKYCPPMSPRQTREFLVDFWTRISMRNQKRRLRTLYGDQFTLEPLLQTVKRIRRCSTKEKKQYLIMFLKIFSKYHRDLYNFRIIKEAMDSINLITEEKIVLLSRENHSLNEFLLPDEKVKEEKPIANHVIIKADIRGSMTINNTMRKMKLNPASYFSLNFFDPISAVLSEYGASKVFIEGDAIILSIFENEDAVQGNYSVARACGLAIRILQIVRSYNEKNKENNLPVLELGIGICYSQDPPTFLFDGNSRIMISQAINQADRLSSCDKLLRKIFKSQNDVFNLFVFESESEEMIDPAADDSTYRYNVNGIELNDEGFNKLAREINLQIFIYPSENDESVKFYTGKVPLTNGNYQRIVIREAPIHKLQPTALDVTGKISKKYYEVCTHHKIYNSIGTQY